ncbi:MAG: acetate--CoA ligase family protein [Deltaproteobacteria bacterium]|nr:acetate--CoA ligase family protein [Deltaproteobacteria bacterium]
MKFFFEPQGIALVGATPKTNTGGYSLLANLTLGYDGSIYPVNPRYPEILGLPCYPSVAEVPDPVDLAIVFVPAPAVPPVLEECAARGLKGVIIESGGFAEVGPEGRALQERCLEIARRSGMRLWGPNCMGLIDIRKRYVFSFIAPDAWQDVLNPGGVSLIVQSGLLAGGFMTTLMSHKILRLAKACSIGNKGDIDETDLLEYFLEDDDTRVIALYVESFPRGRRFFELASQRKKPVVVLKGGKSAAGARAAASHTASLAGNFELIRGALDQAGVYQADDFFELVDLARTLEMDFERTGPPQGKPRVAVFTFSGAAGIVTADHLEASGLALADLAPATRQRLEKLSPSWMPVNNPVDFWPAMEKHGPEITYREGLAALLMDPGVDAIIVHLFAGFGVWFLDVEKLFKGLHETRKPVLFWVMGHEKGYHPTRLSLEGMGFPVFNEIQRVVRVLAGIFEFGAKRESATAATAAPDPGIFQSLKTKIEASRESILDEREAKNLLRKLGLAVVPEILAADLSEVLAAAEGFGYPVVLKGRSPGLVHKTEAGLVRLDLNTAEQLQSAFREMADRPQPPADYLVQPQLQGDLELIAGVVRDPQFGPAVMLGLGGVRAEVYRDVVFRLAPVTKWDVEQMVAKLRGRALLEGFRGATPVNLDLLADWLIRLGDLACRVDAVKEIDVNPLLVVKGEPVAVDASIVLRSMV